jgi:hypothetical protein
MASPGASRGKNPADGSSAAFSGRSHLVYYMARLDEGRDVTDKQHRKEKF